ncbi:DEAD/DEAH box helicase family protein, partial [Mesorhizobium sp. M4B.F.Ca.ET.089.01.1.1]|uniref:DEAD/DEAH box helicase family protein n=1 Tax=Mesorhizobium sp. M4B.F.Ca.ET.089.01.1.1 TaxID=2496662 RepID=UPI00167595A6
YYITSGLKVADQNKAELLRFLDEESADAALSKIDRVGLIPFEPSGPRKLRLYAFTPNTSFCKSQRLYGGKAVERAFISLLLDRIYPGLANDFPYGYIENGATSGWKAACTAAEERIDHVSQRFIASYGRALRTEFGMPARRAILEAVHNTRPGHSLGRMRKALAHAALESTPPDLVIFDEFQCYRHVRSPEDDNPLAKQLLRGKESAAPPPLLLLSATPYRFFAERWETIAGIAPHAELFE